MADELLSDIYYDTAHPAAYRGENSLIQAVRDRVGKNEVKNWLRTQARHIYFTSSVNNIDDLWEIDLVDMQSVKTYNNGVSFLLICIDVLSKYAWVYPLKNKTNISVIKAFESLFESTERRPITIQSDKGKEFV